MFTKITVLVSKFVNQIANQTYFQKIHGFMDIKNLDESLSK